MKTGIIGAGIAGLTTAIAFKNLGIDSMIFEAAPEIRFLGAGLGLGANAIKAFQKIGIANQIISLGKPIKAFSILDEKGNIISNSQRKNQPSKFEINNFSISRARLHEVLLKNIEPQKIVLNKKAIRIKEDGNKINVYFQDNTQESFDRLIVADGIHSPIRKQLLPSSSPRYAGYTAYRAIIENEKLSDNDSPTETWGTKGRFGIVPLAEGKVYWYACLNAPFASEEMKSYKVKDLHDNFKNYHSPVSEILRQSQDQQLIWSDIIDLKPIKQYAFGKVVIIGDAAHAATPNLGQGACQAIEDAVILADEMAKEVTTEQAFLAYERRRMKRIHWIVNTSYQLGKVAQLQNKFLVNARNQFFKLIPPSVNEKQLEKILNVDF